MKRKIIATGDGSKTIHIEDWNEQYHSKHGAVQEAYHVFLKHGLFALERSQVSILEIGFGTGLNALITFYEAKKNGFTIDYVGVEAFPISRGEITQLNYVSLLGENQLRPIYERMHDSPWGQTIVLSPFFSLIKQQKDFFEVEDDASFNLIYFDAFGPRVQPKLWTAELFRKMYRALQTNGILVTYSAKGSVRRNLEEVGFSVERLPGPPGKREMLRAVKT